MAADRSWPRNITRSQVKALTRITGWMARSADILGTSIELRATPSGQLVVFVWHAHWIRGQRELSADWYGVTRRGRVTEHHGSK